jgi:hypothetical protein
VSSVSCNKPNRLCNSETNTRGRKQNALVSALLPNSVFLSFAMDAMRPKSAKSPYRLLLRISFCPKHQAEGETL